MKKRGLSILLAASMVLSMIPGNAFAAEVGNDDELQQEEAISVSEDEEAEAQETDEASETDIIDVTEDIVPENDMPEDIIPMEEYIISETSDTLFSEEEEDVPQLFYVEAYVEDRDENNEPSQFGYNWYSNSFSTTIGNETYLKFFLAKPSVINNGYSYGTPFTELEVSSLTENDTISWPDGLTYKYYEEFDIYQVTAKSRIENEGISANNENTSYGSIQVSCSEPERGFVSELGQYPCLSTASYDENGTCFYYYIHNGYEYIEKNATVSAVFTSGVDSSQIQLSAGLVQDGSILVDGNSTNRYAVKVTIPSGIKSSGYINLSVSKTVIGGTTDTEETGIDGCYCGFLLCYVDTWIDYEFNTLEYNNYASNIISLPYSQGCTGAFLLVKADEIDKVVQGNESIRNLLNNGGAIPVEVTFFPQQESCLEYERFELSSGDYYFNLWATNPVAGRITASYNDIEYSMSFDFRIPDDGFFYDLKGLQYMAAESDGCLYYETAFNNNTVYYHNKNWPSEYFKQENGYSISVTLQSDYDAVGKALDFDPVKISSEEEGERYALAITIPKKADGTLTVSVLQNDESWPWSSICLRNNMPDLFLSVGSIFYEIQEDGSEIPVFYSYGIKNPLEGLSYESINVQFVYGKNRDLSYSVDDSIANGSASRITPINITASEGILVEPYAGYYAISAKKALNGSIDVEYKLDGDDETRTASFPVKFAAPETGFFFDASGTKYIASAVEHGAEDKLTTVYYRISSSFQGPRDNSPYQVRFNEELLDFEYVDDEDHVLDYSTGEGMTPITSIRITLPKNAHGTLVVTELISETSAYLSLIYQGNGIYFVPATLRNEGDTDTLSYSRNFSGSITGKTDQDFYGSFVYAENIYSLLSAIGYDGRLEESKNVHLIEPLSWPEGVVWEKVTDYGFRISADTHLNGNIETAYETYTASVPINIVESYGFYYLQGTEKVYAKNSVFYHNEQAPITELFYRVNPAEVADLTDSEISVSWNGASLSSEIVSCGTDVLNGETVNVSAVKISLSNMETAAHDGVLEISVGQKTDSLELKWEERGLYFVYGFLTVDENQKYQFTSYEEFNNVITGHKNPFTEHAYIGRFVYALPSEIEANDWDKLEYSNNVSCVNDHIFLNYLEEGDCYQITCSGLVDDIITVVFGDASYQIPIKWSVYEYGFFTDLTRAEMISFGDGLPECENGCDIYFMHETEMNYIPEGANVFATLNGRLLSTELVETGPLFEGSTEKRYAIKITIPPLTSYGYLELDYQLANIESPSLRDGSMIIPISPSGYSLFFLEGRLTIDEKTGEKVFVEGSHHWNLDQLTNRPIKGCFVIGTRKGAVSGEAVTLGDWRIAVPNEGELDGLVINKLDDELQYYEIYAEEICMGEISAVDAKNDEVYRMSVEGSVISNGFFEDLEGKRLFGNNQNVFGSDALNMYFRYQDDEYVITESTPYVVKWNKNYPDEWISEGLTTELVPTGETVEINGEKKDVYAIHIRFDRGNYLGVCCLSLQLLDEGGVYDLYLYNQQVNIKKVYVKIKSAEQLSLKAQELVESMTQSFENMDVISSNSGAEGADPVQVAAESAKQAAEDVVAEQNISLTAQDEIVIQPYVDVQVTDAKVDDEGSNSLTLDITPKYDVVLNSTTEEGEVSSQTLESGNVLAVEASEDDPIIVNIPLTEDFVGDSETAYVVHEHGDETYVYDASIDNNQVLTFSNPNGFSMFRVTFDPCKEDHHRIISRGNAIAPTCTEAGKKSDSYCNICQKEYPGAVLSAKGHTEVSANNGKVATCTAVGKESDIICKDCQTVIKAGKVIPMIAHKAVIANNGTAASCTEIGRASDTVCKECGAVITVGKTIPAKGHTWGDWVITDASTKTHTCSVCGAKESQKIDAASVRYKTHVQSYGWQLWKSDGDTAGTSGESKRLEAINIELVNAPAYGSIVYRTHVQTYGWQTWKSDGEMAGTSGEAKRLESIQIYLTGEMAELYDVYYRVHAQTYGWLDWAKNGDPTGTSGLSKRLEAIQIVLVAKGGSAPGSTARAFIGNVNDAASTTPGASVSYRTHVQTYGWQNWKVDGAMSGTSGEAKRLEGIEIKVSDVETSGGIQYRTHVQSIGWQDWRSNGAMAGTTGLAKRLEAIEIQLTGDLAKQYDIYYRVHSQTYGWLGWAKNGESAGTEGLAKRLEAIEIRLVPKGGAAPGSTARAFIK